jgi:hypothetical protein
VCRILRKYERNALSISAVHSGGRRLATKVRVFTDLLAEVFAEAALGYRIEVMRSQVHGNGIAAPRSGARHGAEMKCGPFLVEFGCFALADSA